jgi:hypothetical protein
LPAAAIHRKKIRWHPGSEFLLMAELDHVHSHPTVGSAPAVLIRASPHAINHASRLLPENNTSTSVQNDNRNPARQARRAPARLCIDECG